MFGWFRDRRRRRLLDAPIPAEIDAVLRERAPLITRLPDAQRQRLLDLTRIFIAEKTFEGARGFPITDEVRWVIAAQACLLLLGLTTNPQRARVYPNVRTIIVYPTGFVNPVFRAAGPGGVIGEGSANLGEAHFRGPVIISWAHAARGGADHADGHNLVLHEFAHKLDMLDEVIDGTPPLPDPGAYRCWREVMTDAFEELRLNAASGRASLLDAYGAANPAEFFAVATEVFFERPGDLRARHPPLYAVLRCAYRQDPAEWTGV